MCLPKTGTIIRPLMMVKAEYLGLLFQVAELPISTEHSDANPMADEWIRLARAMVDVITSL